MKSTLFALLLVLLLPAMSDASAKPSAQRSFKGGFSSQKAASTSSSGPGPSSVLSQRLGRQAAQANALRTLDARRAAEQARTAPPPAPPAPAFNQAQPQAIVVHQASNGLGNVVTGFLLGRAMSNGHAHYGASESYGGRAASGSIFGTLLRMLAWLAILALAAWACWRTWKFLRRAEAPSNGNYSLER